MKKHYYFTFLTIFLFGVTSFAQSQLELSFYVHQVEEELCGTSDLEDSTLKITTTTNGPSFIHLLDIPDTQALYDLAAGLSYAIPFRVPEDGCFARAHKMALAFDGLGINTIKVFVEGSIYVETENSPKGYVRWGYHVAPAVCVKKDGIRRVAVIDPSLFDEPTTLYGWIERQWESGKTTIDEVYGATKYSFIPNDADNPDKEEFTDKDLYYMDYYLKYFKDIEDNRFE